MDLSKLPKMSRDRQSSTQHGAPDPSQSSPVEAGDAKPVAEPPPPPPMYMTEDRQPGVGLQVYISLALGVIFMLMGLRFAQWLLATATGQAFDTKVTWMSGPNVGQPVSYFELQGYPAWTDAAFFVFGLALILEAVAVLATARAGPTARNAALLLAIAVSGLATLLNLGLSIFLLGKGVTPLVSLLMTAFGGYITLYLWQLRDVLKIPDVPAR